MKFFLLLLYYLISIINSQIDNGSIAKALACMTILNEKFQGDDPDSEIYSTMMLKCFITITESKAKDLLLNLESGDGQIKLSKKEFKKYTDYTSLKDISEKTLKKKSAELEKALKDFKKIQSQISGDDSDDSLEDYDDDYYEDDDYGKDAPLNMNLFSLIPRALIGIFNVFNDYISLFGLFVIVYFLLYILRRMYEDEKRFNKMKDNYMESFGEYEREKYEEKPKKNKGNNHKT